MFYSEKVKLETSLIKIVKGKIEVCKFNGDEYVTLSILEKGALFGEMALN